MKVFVNALNAKTMDLKFERMIDAAVLNGKIQGLMLAKQIIIFRLSPYGGYGLQIRGAIDELIASMEDEKKELKKLIDEAN